MAGEKAEEEVVNVGLLTTIGSSQCLNCDESSEGGGGGVEEGLEKNVASKESGSRWIVGLERLALGEPDYRLRVSVCRLRVAGFDEEDRESRGRTALEG